MKNKIIFGLDIVMPVMDGEEVLKRLRAKEKYIIKSDLTLVKWYIITI